MRITIAILFVVVTAACTQHNPDSCCTTQPQCDSFGLDHVIGCDGNKVCDPNGVCIAPQCATSVDCTSPDTPICENQLCVAACTTDDECVGIAGRPYCATDGVCVACKDDSQCTLDAPVCDAAARACRGCADDMECPGGVCLEADGTCKLDADVYFVASNGVDAGNCTRSTPCATIPFVLAKTTPPTKIIHILGGNLIVGTSMLTIDHPVYIDGSGTTLGGVLSGPVLHFAPQAQSSVLSHVIVTAPNNPADNPAITVDASVALRVYDAVIKRGIKITNGSVAVFKSTFNDPTVLVGGIDCTSGTVSVDTSTFTASTVKSSNCPVTLKRNRFDETNVACFSISGGTAILENNLFVVGSELDDCGDLLGVAPGSVVRFNTFVNTADVVADGVALACGSDVDVTSNIFAYNSTQPHGPTPTCLAKFSLYDAITTEPLGTNSIMANGATFFANKAAKDFHLATGSPAIGVAEPNLAVTVDLDGTPRPSPTGTAPDMGAFESP
jgi:hypothetical protein